MIIIDPQLKNAYQYLAWVKSSVKYLKNEAQDYATISRAHQINKGINLAMEELVKFCPQLKNKGQK
jgi:hypothetical protein